MSTKSWSLLALFFSVISLMVSITTLTREVPRVLGFDYIGVMVGILALLITALIGAQVGQYVFVDKKIEKIAGKITRIIAHKSANDTAKRVAKETAEQAIDSIAGDIAIIAHGKELMKNVPSLMMLSLFMTVIDNLFKSIEVFNTCTYPQISESSIEDALLSLDKAFEGCIRQGKPRILEGQTDYYKSILKNVHSSHKEKCISYLQVAKECPSSIDDDLREAESSAEIDRIIEGHIGSD